MGMPGLSPGPHARDWGARKDHKTSTDDGKSMKRSTPKSVCRARLVAGETVGEVSSHNPADGRIIVSIASSDTLVGCHMIRNSVSDRYSCVLPPPNSLPSGLRAQFNTHRSNMGAAV